MGAVCTCVDSTGPSYLNLTKEERAGIAGDKIFKSKYVGKLFELRDPVYDSDKACVVYQSGHGAYN